MKTVLEGSAKGLVRRESSVPKRIDELLPQVNQMLIQRQMQESLDRLTNRDTSRTTYDRIDIPEPFKKFYIKLYFDHPYWKLIEFDRTGPVLIGDLPDLTQYRMEYNEQVQQMENLAEALMRVAFPQAGEAPKAPTAGAAAAAVAAQPATDAVAEIKKYKELLDAGIITEEEFAAKKKQLMGI